MSAPAPARPAYPRFRRAAHVLAPMQPPVKRADRQQHPTTLAWRAATYYLDNLICPEN